MGDLAAVMGNLEVKRGLRGLDNRIVRALSGDCQTVYKHICALTLSINGCHASAAAYYKLGL